jgi:phosphosulfolactate synthase (CoM biosynthesis protein A)
VLETSGDYVDILKFAGGLFTLMPTHVVRELIDISHAHDVKVIYRRLPSGGLTQGLRRSTFIQTYQSVGFDIVEVSSGFYHIADRRLALLIENVQSGGPEGQGRDRHSVWCRRRECRGRIGS